MLKKNKSKLLISTAIVSVMLAHQASARSLREAPALPSIEIYFDAINTLKADEKQRLAEINSLEKQKKKQQLAQKKTKGKAKDETKIARKKEGKKSQHAEVVKKKHPTKIAKNEPQIHAKKKHVKKEVAQNIMPLVPVVPEVKIPKAEKIAKSHAKKAEPVVAAIPPMPMLPPLPTLPPLAENNINAPVPLPMPAPVPVVEPKAPDLSANKPIEVQPEKIEVAKPVEEVAPPPVAAAQPSFMQKLNSSVFGTSDSSAPATEEKAQVKGVAEPAIPQLADVVELKQVKNISDEQAAKNDNKPIDLADAVPAPVEEPKPVVIPNAAESAPVAAEAPPAPAEIQIASATTSKPTAFNDVQPIKQTFLTPLFDWLYSFQKNKAVDISDLAIADVKDKSPGHHLEMAESAPAYLDDLAAKNASTPAAPQAQEPKNGVDFVAHTPEAQPSAKILSASEQPQQLTSFEPTALPQVEEIVSPVIEKKNEDGSLLRLNFYGTETNVSDGDIEKIKDFVKKIAATQQKVKIVSYAGGSGSDANAAKRISLKRAIAIRSKMIEAGLDSSRINVQAAGDDKKSNSVSVFLVEGL
jgi:outer membrane protein OmpA-like peptidoglycan-associated protein